MHLFAHILLTALLLLFSGLSSFTAGTSIATTALTSVSGGVGAGAGTTVSSSVDGSMLTQGGSGLTGKGPKTSEGLGGTTVLSGTNSVMSSLSTTATVETVGGTRTSKTASSTGGGAMITQGPLLLVGGAAALFAYGVM